MLNFKKKSSTSELIGLATVAKLPVSDTEVDVLLASVVFEDEC